MKGSYYARIIDEEYRNKKEYESIKRRKCSEHDCNRCKFNQICDNNISLEGDSIGKIL